MFFSRALEKHLRKKNIFFSAVRIENLCEILHASNLAHVTMHAVNVSARLLWMDFTCAA